MKKKESKTVLGGLRGWFLAALVLLALAAGLAGCSTPEGGSSMPWSQPEPWEQQPSFGVPY